MNEKEKVRAAMKESYVEITEAEFDVIDGEGEISISIYERPDRDTPNLYFKPKVKFPLVYEDCMRKVEVDRDGSLRIHGAGDDLIKFSSSLDILEDAMAMSKKLRGKK